MTKITGKIKKIKDENGQVFFPVTSAKAVYFGDGESTLDDNWITLEDIDDESVELKEPSVREDVNTWLDFKRDGGHIGGMSTVERRIAAVDSDNSTMIGLTGNSILSTTEKNNKFVELFLNPTSNGDGVIEKNPIKIATLGRPENPFSGLWHGSCEKNVNGYMSLGNGMLLTWGKAELEFNNTPYAFKHVTYPISIPNRVYGAWCSCIETKNMTNGHYPLNVINEIDLVDHGTARLGGISSVNQNISGTAIILYYILGY